MRSPCDVYELWTESTHALDTIEEILETLRRCGQSAEVNIERKLHFER